MFIAYSMEARTGHNHGFGFAVDKVCNLFVEMIEHNRNLLRNSLLVKVYKRFEQQSSFGAIIVRVGLDLFEQAPVGFVGCIVFQHIKNKTFFYGLPHGIEAECLISSTLTRNAEEFEGFGFGGGREGKITDVGQSTALAHLFRNTIFQVIFLVAFFYIGIIKTPDSENDLEAFGAFTTLRVVGFIHDDGEAFDW